jgi:hypothetical protein
MEHLTKYVIDKHHYFEGNQLISAGIGQLAEFTNSRRMIEGLDIPKEYYIYARYNKKSKVWKKTNGKCIRLDKVFIRPIWVENYLKLLEEDDDDEEEEEIDEEEEIEEPVIEEVPVAESNNGTIGKAPPIITLKKREKLKDNEGNIVEIQVRGTREYNNCFFLIDDVSEGFQMDNLRDVVLNKNRRYVPYQHYRFFMVDDNPNNVRTKTKIKKNKQSKQLFLTYQGLLRALFVSRNDRVSKFLDWATKTLFTAHLGTKEDKRKLSSELMGISVNVLKEVFNKTSSKLPVVYLFSVGTVGELRISLEIDDKYDDNLIVCKGGETNDLTRRTTEHSNYYGKLAGSNMGLLWYNYIDPQYVTTAETEILHIMKQMGFLMEHKKHDELIVFSSKKDLKTIQDQFIMVTNKYMGHIGELQKKLTELENKLANIQKDHEKEITYIRKDYDTEISSLKKDYDTEISSLKKDYDIEILRKDEKITNLQEKLSDVKKDHEKEMQYLKKDYEHQLSLLRSQHSNEIMKKDREIEEKDSCIKKLTKRTKYYKKKLGCN